MRTDLLEYGIGTENFQKLVSKDDSGATSGCTAKVQDKLMFDIFGTTQRLKLNKVLENTGLFLPNRMMNNLDYIITLPSSSDVLITQTGEASTSYSLQNLQLGYETVTNSDLANEIESVFLSGKSILCEHITMFQKIAWPKANTIQNINVNVPRKSMNFIRVLKLFYSEKRSESLTGIEPVTF